MRKPEEYEEQVDPCPEHLYSEGVMEEDRANGKSAYAVQLDDALRL